VKRLAENAVERARIEADSLVTTIARRRTSIEEAFYDIGESLSKLREKRLYSALGFERFDDLVQARLGISPVQARKLIGITEQLTRARAVSLGQERAAALVRLAAATNKPDTAETLAREGIWLPGKSGRVAPDKLSVRAILGAARAHRRSPRGAAPAARDARKRMESVAEAIRRRLLDAGASRAASNVNIRGKGTANLSVVVELEVPLEDAAILAKILSAAR